MDPGGPQSMGLQRVGHSCKARSHYLILKQRENPERFEQENNIIKTVLINDFN